MQNRAQLAYLAALAAFPMETVLVACIETRLQSWLATRRAGNAAGIAQERWMPA